MSNTNSFNADEMRAVKRGTQVLVSPDANLTPDAKVLYDEIVSNFEDWVSRNEIEPTDVVMAVRAVESYIVSRAMGIR